MVVELVELVVMELVVDQFGSWWYTWQAVEEQVLCQFPTV